MKKKSVVVTSVMAVVLFGMSVFAWVKTPILKVPTIPETNLKPLSKKRMILTKDIFPRVIFPKKKLRNKPILQIRNPLSCRN